MSVRLARVQFRGSTVVNVSMVVGKHTMAENTFVSSTTVCLFATLRQEPPPSIKVRAVIPRPASTTRSFPAESKWMLRGLVRLFATSLAVYPAATDGAGYDAVKVAEQDDDD